MHEILPKPPHGYRLIRLLGQGAFKQAFEAVRLDTNEHVALKRYRSNTGGWIDPKDLTINFLDVQFHHKNVLPSHWIAGSWIAEPLLSTDLSMHLAPEHRLSINDLLNVAKGLVEGLAFLHANGLIHGDIKPHNMGLQSGVPVLCDFGTASFFTNARRRFRNYPGTLRTRPPELHGQNVLPTPASDVWMMGASILALVAGFYPFIREEEITKDSSHRLAKRRTTEGIRRGELALHNRIVGSVSPRWLALLLCHSLRFDPKLRITADQLHCCLQQQVSGPNSRLANWLEFRDTAREAAYQEDREKLKRLIKQLTKRAYEHDSLLQEYIFDGLPDDDPFLSLACYDVLYLGLAQHRHRMNSRSPTLRRIAESDLLMGKVLASLLLHLAHHRTILQRDVLERFSTGGGQFVLFYNYYGKLYYKRLSLKEFKRLLRAEKKHLRSPQTFKRRLLISGGALGDSYLANEVWGKRELTWEPRSE